MPDRDEEVRHLADADRHIRSAERAIQEMRIEVGEQRALGADTTLSSRLLAAMEEMLEQFVEHRGVILQTIADLDAGRL